MIQIAKASVELEVVVKFGNDGWSSSQSESFPRMGIVRIVEGFEAITSIVALKADWMESMGTQH